MNKLATSLEVLATCLLGLMAGFFFAFAVDVAPAMHTLDARSYVATQQAINIAVRNIPFAVAYFGSAILPLAAATVLMLAGRKRAAWGWFALSAVYLLGVYIVTRQINVPINEAMAAWNPSAPPAGWQELRDTWNLANLARCIVACLAFAAAVGLSRLTASER